MAFSLRVRPRERDIIVSVLAVLKSPLVDVEDFDRMVSAGTGQLEPGALLLNFTPRVGLSVFLVAVSTCSAGPGPPAQPLDRQSVALSVGGRVMKGDNGSAALDHSTRGGRGRELHDVKNRPVSTIRAAVQTPPPPPTHTNNTIQCFLLRTTSSSAHPVASRESQQGLKLESGCACAVFFEKDTRRRSHRTRSSRVRQRSAAQGATCTTGSCRTPGLQPAGSCGEEAIFEGLTCLIGRVFKIRALQASGAVCNTL